MSVEGRCDECGKEDAPDVIEQPHPYNTSVTAVLCATCAIRLSAEAYQEGGDEGDEDGDVPCEGCGWYYPPAAMTDRWGTRYCPSCNDRFAHPEEFV